MDNARGGHVTATLAQVKQPKPAGTLRTMQWQSRSRLLPAHHRPMLYAVLAISSMTSDSVADWSAVMAGWPTTSAFASSSNQLLQHFQRGWTAKRQAANHPRRHPISNNCTDPWQSLASPLWDGDVRWNSDPSLARVPRAAKASDSCPPYMRRTSVH